MSKRLLEKCPHCNHDLGVALNRYLFQSLPGLNFEFECPNCKITVEVEVESQPIFWVSKVSRPTQDAPDGAKRRLTGRNGKPTNVLADGTLDPAPPVI